MLFLSQSYNRRHSPPEFSEPFFYLFFKYFSCYSLPLNPSLLPPLETRSFPPSGQTLRFPPPLTFPRHSLHQQVPHAARCSSSKTPFFPSLLKHFSVRPHVSFSFHSSYSLRTFSPPFLKAAAYPLQYCRPLCSTALIMGLG